MMIKTVAAKRVPKGSRIIFKVNSRGGKWNKDHLRRRVKSEVQRNKVKRLRKHVGIHMKVLSIEGRRGIA